MTIYVVVSYEVAGGAKTLIKAFTSYPAARAYRAHRTVDETGDAQYAVQELELVEEAA